MATEQLKVKITADASQAKAEIGKFKTQLKKTTDQASDSSTTMGRLKGSIESLKGAASGSVSSMGAMTASVGKLATAAGAAMAAIAALKASISNAIAVAAMGDEIKDNAQKVFMGTTAYQEWGYVLKQNGVDISALKMGMRQFSQQVATGSEALRRYGITSSDVDVAFQQAIYTIQNMSTETEKIAAATELFGARALELFPILNLTNSETQGLMNTYRALGGTMSNELIAASDICTDSITEMKMAWGGLRNLLATYVIPVVTKVVQWITVAIAKIRILLAAILGIKESFGGSKKSSSSGNRSSGIAGTTSRIANNTGGAAKNLKKAAKHAKELKRTLMGIDELSKLAEQATAAAASGGTSGGGGGVSVGGGGGGIDTSGLEAANDIFSSDILEKIEKFREKVEAVSDKLHGMGLIIKGLWELATGNWRAGIDDVTSGLGLIFPQIADLKEKWADLKARFTEKIVTFITVTLPDWASTLKKKWEDLKAKFTGKAVGISFSLPAWGGNLKKSWDNLKKKFTSAKVKISLTFSAAVGDLKKWINNNVIAKINAKFKKVPILKNHLIPRLASGGVLTAPTTAILGEYPGARSNPEIATPQSLMMETMKAANGELVSSFATMTRQVIAAIEEKDLSVKIGDEQIARSAQRGNSAYYSRTGRPLLSL